MLNIMIHEVIMIEGRDKRREIATFKLKCDSIHASNMHKCYLTTTLFQSRMSGFVVKMFGEVSREEN